MRSDPLIINYMRDVARAAIFHVQLADAAAPGTPAALQSDTGGLLPGQGRLNLASFVRVLARAGYQGPWSLAGVTPPADGAHDTLAQDGYRALVALLDEVATTEPALPQPLPGLPTPQ